MSLLLQLFDAVASLKGIVVTVCRHRTKSNPWSMHLVESGEKRLQLMFFFSDFESMNDQAVNSKQVLS